MSRAISPDIWRDDWFGNLDHIRRLIWIGLLTCCADDQGRMIDSPRLIVADLFPYDETVNNQMVREALDTFIRAGKLHAYQAGDKSLLQIINWWRYQSSAAWMGASHYQAPDGWIDRSRYHGPQRKILESNWDKPGGFISLPNSLPSGLGRAGEEVKVKEEVKGDDEVKGEGETNPPPTNRAPASTVDQHQNPQDEPDRGTAVISDESEDLTIKTECGYTHLDLMQISAAWEKFLHSIDVRDIDNAIRSKLEPTAPIAIDNQPDQVLITIHANNRDDAELLQQRVANLAGRALPGWIPVAVPYQIQFVNGSK